MVKKKNNRFRNVIMILYPALGILVLLILFSSLIAGKVKSDLFKTEVPVDSLVVDTIQVHFIHGSIPRDDCEYQKRRLGGFLGGHIEIEFQGEVFGFMYDSLPMNYFPHPSPNSKFEFRTKNDWLSHTVNDKITSVYIPLSMNQFAKLDSIRSFYKRTSPYDYAFLGQRCASSTAEILSNSGVINSFSKTESIISFFYPRTLRRALLKFATLNNLNVQKKEGIDCHIWEE